MTATEPTDQSGESTFEDRMADAQFEQTGHLSAKVLKALQDAMPAPAVMIAAAPPEAPAAASVSRWLPVGDETFGFDEDLHPRDYHGRWGSGSNDSDQQGGGSKSGGSGTRGTPTGKGSAAQEKNKIGSRVTEDHPKQPGGVRVRRSSGDGPVINWHPHKWKTERALTFRALAAEFKDDDDLVQMFLDAATELEYDEGLHPRDDHGRWGSGSGGGDEKIAAAKGGFLSSQERYQQKDGTYTPERQALHDQIVAGILDHVPAATGTPQVYILGGGPASGKTSAQNQDVSGMPKSGDPKTALVNADEIREKLPEYGQLLALKDPSAAAFTHEEASDIVKQALTAATDKGVNMVYDGTGDNSVQKFSAKLDDLTRNGAEAHGVYVTIPTADALSRAQARAVGTADRPGSGRFVPDNVLVNTHIGVSTTMPGLIDKFKDIQLWDNSQKAGDPPTLVMSGGKGMSTQIHDQEKWQQFLDKANEPKMADVAEPGVRPISERASVAKWVSFDTADPQPDPSVWNPDWLRAPDPCSDLVVGLYVACLNGMTFKGTGAPPEWQPYWQSIHKSIATAPKDTIFYVPSDLPNV